MKTPIYPRSLRQLPATRWTSPRDLRLYCHWEVEGIRPSTGEVVLRATLDRAHKLIIPWRDLQDRSSWVPGWS
jgi:tryptophan-rich hypothetical protein